MNERPIRPDDLPALVETIRALEERVTSRPSRVGVEDLEGWLGGVDLDADSWLLAEDDRLLGFGWVRPRGGELAAANGFVHPDATGRGLGARLVERSERRARELGLRRVHQGTLVDPAAVGLLTSRGYREVRRFYEMTIELTEEPVVPEPPAGISIERFDEADARAFHAALDESFRDHWEHHPRSFEEWWERNTSSALFDSSLWFLARAGDELAGVAANFPASEGGYVGTLGVRRPWRGRGVARALLLRSFAEFHARGWRRASLGVDASNPTGATRLYESVGMTVDLEEVVFEKVLA